MNIGVVELPSGKWEWSAFRSAGGTTIVYRHWTRYEEEMRTWIPRYEVTAEEVREAALDSILRIWVDGFGSRWQLGLEPMPASRPDPKGRIWLVFARGTLKVRVAVPREARLGELTPTELTRLLSAGEEESSAARLSRPTTWDLRALSAA